MSAKTRFTLPMTLPQFMALGQLARIDLPEWIEGFLQQYFPLQSAHSPTDEELAESLFGLMASGLITRDLEVDEELLRALGGLSAVEYSTVHFAGRGYAALELVASATQDGYTVLSIERPGLIRVSFDHDVERGRGELSQALVAARLAPLAMEARGEHDRTVSEVLKADRYILLCVTSIIAAEDDTTLGILRSTDGQYLVDPNGDPADRVVRPIDDADAESAINRMLSHAV